MASGNLIIQIYADNEANPVKDAQVTITADNYQKTYFSDESGKIVINNLSAPDKMYSMYPQNEVRPYSTYNLKAEKQGLQTTFINNVEVMDGQTSIQSIYMSSNPIKRVYADIINLPGHSLWENDPGKVSEDLFSEERAFPEVLIPEYIIVHDGIPSNTNASNYIVRFIDYIKNVASSEIYSTWPKEAITANVHAIVSFTLNRIFTEWYKSRGYNFTITSSPQYDQYYVHNRTIYQSISNVVDEVFSKYIRIYNNQFPFFAQYNDGIKTNNPGWLSQWGSKEKGDQGYSALEILKYFYTTNLELVEADEIIGLPLSFPGYNLKNGMCGEAIYKIQNELNKVSGSYPAIPKIIPANGKFEKSTEDSVRKFQSVFNIPVTGIINFATWYEISYKFIAVSRMIDGISR